jgi:GDP-L-fucose synthase
MATVKNDTIFVAGGTGMVGSAIIRGLLAAGYTQITTNYHTRKPMSGLPSPVAFVELDLTNQSDTERFFASTKPGYVYLAAAKVGGILANDTYKAEFIYENMMIAANVISAAHRHGVKKLLNLGSSCIYPRFAPQPMKEEFLLTGELEPTNEPYSVAKIAAIKLCRYFNEQYGTNFLSVMPTNLYGPHDNFNLETAHMLPALIRKFHLGKLLRNRDVDAIRRDLGLHRLGFGLDKKLHMDDDASLVSMLAEAGIRAEYVLLWGTGGPFREFLHVDELASACIMLMEQCDYKDVGEFVNIGTGEEMRISDLALLIKEIVDFEGEIRHDLTKKDGMPRKLLDIHRIKQLGWSPVMSLAEGIRQTYAWYREQNEKGL